MRGKVGLIAALGHIQRITPAYAGKRQQGWTAGGGNRDHPRVCGEKKTKEITIGEQKGSPPRMRGKD